LNFTPSNSLTWTYNSGGAFPGATVGITNSTAASYNAQATSTGTWLLVNNNTFSSGVPSQGLTLSASSNVTSLATGQYQGTVQVNDSNGQTGTITVTLSVNGGTTTGLTISPGSLSFNSAVNGSSQQQNLSVTSTSGGNFSVNVSSNGSFLSATPNTSNLASNTQGTVSVIANPGSLGNGTYSGTVTVTVGSQSQAIPVQLVVGSGGGGGGGTVSGVAPSSISLVYQTGTPGAFVNRPVIAITGISGAWSSNITYAQGTGWLSLDKTSGSSLPDQTTVIANPVALSAGTYSATISFTTPSGTQNVSVTLVVVNSAVLLPTPGGLVFSYQSGGSLPSGQSVFFSASDGSQFDLTGVVTSNASWLTFTTFQKSLQVAVDPTGLAGGLYSGTLAVAPPGLPAVNFPVVLIVNGGTGGGGGSNGPLSFNPASLSFSTAVGSNPNSQSVFISANPAASFTATSNSTWLSFAPTSGTAPATGSVQVNSANLPAGTYNGAITFNTGGATQTLNVSLTVGSGGGGGGSGNVSVTPTSLTYSGQTGTGTLNSQQIQISSTGGGNVSYFVAATTSTGGNWLSTGVGPGALTTSSNPTITPVVTLTGLAAGTYSGTITIPPNGGTAVNIPVTLTLTSPPLVSATPTTLTFAYRAGSATPSAQTLAVSGNGSTLTFSATATSAGNWLQVSPATGTTPGNVSVTVNPSGLSAGTYSGTITVAGTNGAPGSTTVVVTLNVTAPLPTITKVGNAASYVAGNIAPGEIITIFGTDLGPASPVTLALDSTGKVATTLGGVQVLVNGFLAPMIYASNTQVGAVVPYELAQFASANVLVRFLGQSSNGVATNVATTAPGVFTLNASGSGPAAILNQNNSGNSPSNPAARGDTIVLYLTGEGQTSPAGVTGKVTTTSSTGPLTPGPLLPVSVTIAGQPAAAILFAGEAPGFVSGVMQMNVTIPTTSSSGGTFPTGDLPIVVTIGPNSSQPGVTVSVR